MGDERRPARPAGRRWRWMVSLVGLLTVLTPMPVTSAGPGQLTITVLGNRADLVSGGAALVDIDVPAGVAFERLRVRLDGQDATGAFAVRPNGRVQGLVAGLAVGANELEVRAPGLDGARLTITNHPIGGPVFSGPHIQPWTCAAGAVDDDCNRPPTYRYLYQPSGGGELQPYDPADPPDDVATTETDEGAVVPFIVREETGVIARDPRPRQRRPQLQHRHPGRVARHDEGALRRGLRTDPLHDRFRLLRWRAGAAAGRQRLPGHLPGHHARLQLPRRVDLRHAVRRLRPPARVLPGPDAVVARHRVGAGADRPGARSPQPREPGHLHHRDPQFGPPHPRLPGRPERGRLRRRAQPRRGPLHPPRLHAERLRYRPADRLRPPSRRQRRRDVRPRGPARRHAAAAAVRGRQHEDRRRRRRLRRDARAVRRRCPRLPAGLPQRRGEHRPAPRRSRDHRHAGARPRSLPRRVPDLRPAGTADPEHGTADNQVLWRGSVPILGDTTFTNEGIFAMDRWLAVVEQDHRDLPLAQKIIEARETAGVVDRCTSGTGEDVPMQHCEAVVQRYATPRIAAGMPTTDDVLQCALKPLRRADFPGVLFTEAQWQALQSAFPTGVCDYTEPDPNRVATVPWLTYANGPSGEPLGDPPTSVSLR